MHYARDDIALAFEQGTRMLCVRAIIALAIAVTFPQITYAQNAIHVIIAPVGETPQANPPPCTPASCQKLVPRYDIKTYMLGILEYNTATCEENTPGEWTGYPSETDNKGKVSTDFKEEPQGPPCNPKGTYTYAFIIFAWTAHNNHSTPHPSKVLGYPMDQFNATWKDANTDGFTHSCFCTGPFTYTFNPYTKVVHPVGEESEFVNFTSSHTGGTYGRWKMTLHCCAPKGANGTGGDNDSTFDFNGEAIKEKFGTGFNTCQSRAPSIVTPQTGTPPGLPASWRVGEFKDAGDVTTPAPKNVWGYDFTGFDACTIFAYRCANVTEPPCGIQLHQGITIHTPADADNTFSAPLYTNIIGEGIGGVIYPTPQPKFGFGPLTATRFSGDTGGTYSFPGYTSPESDCLARPLVLSNLKNHPGSCLAARPGPADTVPK